MTTERSSLTLSPRVGSAEMRTPPSSGMRAEETTCLIASAAPRLIASTVITPLAWIGGSLKDYPLCRRSSVPLECLAIPGLEVLRKDSPRPVSLKTDFENSELTQRRQTVGEGSLLDPDFTNETGLVTVALLVLGASYLLARLPSLAGRLNRVLRTVVQSLRSLHLRSGAGKSVRNETRAAQLGFAAGPFYLERSYPQVFRVSARRFRWASVRQKDVSD